MNEIKLTDAQMRVVNLSTDKPVLIRGVAGSGKTHTAISRLNQIIAQSDMFEKPRVAVFSFARTLINDIKKSLIGAEVECIHFHGWARNFLSQYKFQENNIHQSHSVKLIKDILTEVRGQYPDKNILKKAPAFFLDEISWLKGRMINTFGLYLEANRTGRGNAHRVSRENKLLVWDIFSQYNAKLKELGYNDYEDHALLCHHHLKVSPPPEPLYNHIIIDEAQDLSQAQLMVLSSLVDPQKQSITLIADTAQRIYKRDLSWEEVGVNIHGSRSVELKSNFRNTIQIADAAKSLLAHDQDNQDFTDGYTPTQLGEKPSVIQCKTFIEQGEVLLSKLSLIDDLSSVIVLSKNKKDLASLECNLEKHGYKIHNISNGANQVKNDVGTITTCTIHSVKGLQFEHVFICDLNEMKLPGKTMLEGDGYTEHISVERKVLYVGMTRAKSSLTMLTSDVASRFIKELDTSTVHVQKYEHTLSNDKEANAPVIKPHQLIDSTKSLVSTLRRTPENLSLLSDDELIRLNTDHVKMNLNSIAISQILGEMLYRLWLYQDNASIALKEEIQNFIGKDMLTSFEREYAIYREAPRAGCSGLSPLWQHSTEQHKLMGQVACAKIRICLTADGMVTVIKADRPVPIMFTLKPAVAKSTLYVFDSRNQKIGGWSSSINELHQYDIQGWSVKLHITATDDINFTGQSLDLPILMAILKKEGRLPLFSHLQVCATGAIDYGMLEKVGYVDIKRRLATQLDTQLFIYPISSPTSETDTGLPCGMSIQDVHNTVNYMILDQGLGELSSEAAVNELEKLNNDVHFGVIAMEEKALNRLDMIEKDLKRHRLGPELVKAQILRAAIYCHLGRTKDASELNEHVFKQALEMELYYTCAEAHIRQIVNNTDLGNFKTATANTAELQNWIELSHNFDQPTRNELLMKHHGSVGQLYMYQALADSDTTLEAKAIEHIDTAISYASHVEDTANILIDLNYKHMWHILFDPANAKTAYITAKSAIMNAPNADKRATNIDYLNYQSLYAVYRNYLLTGEINSFEEFDVSQNCKISWLKPLCIKYQAALTAGAGDIIKAKTLFEQSIVALDQESNPLLFLLGMTIRVQAWQSLKGTEFNEFALQCRDATLDYFEQESILKTYVFTQKWLEFVKDDSKPNPQLQYQY